MSIPLPAHILVIDEIPLIAVGLQEVLRSVDPTLHVEYTETVFTALSARSFEGTTWAMIVLGSTEESPPGSLLLPAAELKQKVPGSRIMIYTDRYDSAIIAQVASGAIDACVHKHEGADEVLNAWRRLSAGETYLSPKFTRGPQ